MLYALRTIRGIFRSVKKLCLVVILGCLGTSFVCFVKYTQGTKALSRMRRQPEVSVGKALHSSTTLEFSNNQSALDKITPQFIHFVASERIQQKVKSFSRKIMRKSYFVEKISSDTLNTFYDSEEVPLCDENSAIYVAISGGADGRLGNRMFQYASLLGISVEAKRKGFCVFPVFEQKSHLFSLFRGFRLNQIRTIYAMNITVSLSEDKAMVYSSKISPAIRPGNNYTVRTFLQSWKYFKNIFNLIRQEFQFNDDILEEAGGFLLQVAKNTSPNTTFVGIHIRRGDMAIESSLKRGYATADRKYIDNAMKYYRAIFSNVTFVVCSDDPTWATKNMNTSDVHFSWNRSAEVDMAILSMCDHSVITSGSFGWWSAWLAGGIVVYYKNFPSPGSWLDSVCERSDYYLPSWIGMV